MRRKWRDRMKLPSNNTGALQSTRGTWEEVSWVYGILQRGREFQWDGLSLWRACNLLV